MQFKLAASFPEEVDELPFAASLGVREDIKKVFSVVLKKGQDFKIYEVRGRIEDVPVDESLRFNRKDPKAKPKLSRTMNFSPL